MADWTTLTTPSAGDPVSVADFFTPLTNDLTHLHDLLTRYVTNDTGGSVPKGYVGVLSGTADNSLLATTTPGDTRVVAVTMGTAAASALHYVGVFGVVDTVLVAGNVSRGSALQTSGTAGYAMQGTVTPFARALTAYAGTAGTVVALIHNQGAGLALPLAGHVIQDEGGAVTQQPNLNFVGDGVSVTNDAGNTASVVHVDTDYVTAMFFS
jgi:hypothetical protein